VSAVLTSPETKRAEILAAAAQAIAKHGYHGMSMRELARATGRSPASVYNYFESKEELLFSVQRDAFATLLESAESVLEGVENPIARLYLFILSHIRHFSDNPAEMRVLIHEASALPPRHRSEVRRRKEAYYVLLHSIIQDIMQQSRSRGRPDAAEVERTTYCVFGMLNWMYGWYEPERHGSTEVLARSIHRIILGGLAEHSPFSAMQRKMDAHFTAHVRAQEGVRG
jgi:AcrR family transcriptional regulator